MYFWIIILSFPVLKWGWDVSQSVRKRDNVRYGFSSFARNICQIEEVMFSFPSDTALDCPPLKQISETSPLMSPPTSCWSLYPITLRIKT